VSAFDLIHLNFFFKELDQLTGVAAILRFPMQELEDEVESSSDDD
jgi:hypothetical protein